MIKNILGERRTYSDVAYTHDHSFAQLILPLQGSLSIKTESYQLELGESRLFFLPPHCEHTFSAHCHNEFLVLDVPCFLLENASMRGGLSPVLDERWRSLRLLMLSEVNDSPAAPNLTDLFRYAYSLLQKESTPPSIHHLHHHFDEGVSLQKLAQLEGYSQTYYCQWFKKTAGMTPKAYIQALRLKRAKELLAQTDMSILQVAQQVGYEHHSSLTRLFQQQERTTPLIYRQQSRNLAKQ